MMYYSDKARTSAIANIRDCIEKVGTIKGSELSYADARKISNFLSILIDEIKKESREQRNLFLQKQTNKGKENESIARVSELIELLLQCPPNDLILADICGEEESADITDVLVGNGTLKGFCYIKVNKYEDI